jgi:hypothetical protein
MARPPVTPDTNQADKRRKPAPTFFEPWKQGAQIKEKK